MSPVVRDAQGPEAPHHRHWRHQQQNVKWAEDAVSDDPLQREPMRVAPCIRSDKDRQCDQKFRDTDLAAGRKSETPFATSSRSVIEAAYGARQGEAPIKKQKRGPLQNGPLPCRASPVQPELMENPSARGVEPSRRYVPSKRCGEGCPMARTKKSRPKAALGSTGRHQQGRSHQKRSLSPAPMNLNLNVVN